MKFGIIGAGGHAREVRSYAPMEVAYMAVSRGYESGDVKALEDLDDEQRRIPCVVAVGAPLVRRCMIDRYNLKIFTNVVAKLALVDESVELGLGNQVAPNSIIMPNSVLGNHTIINIAATVSHDTVIGDFATLCPGVHVGGSVNIGKGVFLGIGSSISNGVSIADGVVLGAGSVLVADADVLNGVYVGVPAKLKKVNEDWIGNV